MSNRAFVFLRRLNDQRSRFLGVVTVRPEPATDAQIQVELKFKRVQYVAYEPVIATVQITNLAGRNIELRDGNGQHWFGFEITTNDQRLVERVERAGIVAHAPGDGAELM